MEGVGFWGVVFFFDGDVFIRNYGWNSFYVFFYEGFIVFYFIKSWKILVIKINMLTFLILYSGFFLWMFEKLGGFNLRLEFSLCGFG